MTRDEMNEMAAKGVIKGELSDAQREALSGTPLRIASLLAYLAASIAKDDPNQFVRLALSSILNDIAKELLCPNAVERPQ